MIDIILASALIVSVYMSSIFVLATVIKDNSIVDIGWGFGFVVLAIALVLFIGEPGVSALQLIVTTLVIAWGLRLGGHILLRKKTKDGWKAEDFRYAAWRKSWKRFHLRSFFQIYMLQGLLMLLISAPLFVAEFHTELVAKGAVNSLQETSSLPVLLLIIGLVIWLIGFVFEAVGDYQLTQFMATKKKGQIMRTGLWSLTRHPNYFGELTMWWGIWLIVLAYIYGLLAVVSPIVITYLLLKVSGVTMLEKKWNNNKSYQKYKKEVPAIFPVSVS